MVALSHPGRWRQKASGRRVTALVIPLTFWDAVAARLHPQGIRTLATARTDVVSLIGLTARVIPSCSTASSKSWSMRPTPRPSTSSGRRWGR